MAFWTREELEEPIVDSIADYDVELFLTDEDQESNRFV